MRVSQASYYQLTHDYLVHSVRDWLTVKQKETWRGRAELRLAERSARWNDRPESRYLPSVWERARFRLFTRSRGWAPQQRRMMGKADRYHAARLLVLAAILVFLGWGAWEYRGQTEAQELRNASWERP